MLISREAIRGIAIAIRPHITPILEEKGMVDDDDVKRLSREHSGRQVVSRRTLDMIQEFLCDV